MAEGIPTRTPGQLLRAAREARGADLAAAHEGTKIPVNLLEAIERDEYHKLSGPLYVKSFLRNYATWVGLDPDEILRVYELATGRPEATPSADAEIWSEDQVSVTRVGVPWGRYVAIGAGVLAALAVVVWLIVGLVRGGDEPEAAAVVVVEAPVEVPPPVEQEPETGTRSQAARSGVRSKVPPDRGGETDAERLARLQRDSLMVGIDAPVPGETTGDAAGRPSRTVTLAPPRRGDSGLRFTGGQTHALVLRIVVPAPVNCSVLRDADSQAVPVIWPESPTAPPAYNIHHGLAYAVTGGYVVYWGADDHFTLVLDRLQGAEVTLNGEPLPVSRWRPGQAVVLDRFTLERGDG